MNPGMLFHLVGLGCDVLFRVFPVCGKESHSGEDQSHSQIRQMDRFVGNHVGAVRVAEGRDLLEEFRILREIGEDVAKIRENGDPQSDADTAF